MTSRATDMRVRFEGIRLARFREFGKAVAREAGGLEQEERSFESLAGD
jgi:hypothetical protein